MPLEPIMGIRLAELMSYGDFKIVQLAKSDIRDQTDQAVPFNTWSAGALQHPWLGCIYSWIMTGLVVSKLCRTIFTGLFHLRVSCQVAFKLPLQPNR